MSHSGNAITTADGTVADSAAPAAGAAAAADDLVVQVRGLRRVFGTTGRARRHRPVAASR